MLQLSIGIFKFSVLFLIVPGPRSGAGKGPDSEAIDEELRAPLPRRRSRILRLSPSDDDKDDDEQDGGSFPPIPKKDRTGLISRGSTPAPRRTADAPSASKLPEVDPSSRLSGFKFGRRPLELTGDDQ